MMRREARSTNPSGRANRPTKKRSERGTPRDAAQTRVESKPVAARTTAPQSPFLDLIGAVRPEVDRRLRDYLRERTAEAKALGTELGPVVGAMRDLCLRGGKRLRAGLLVVGYECASASAPSTVALEAGVAVELLQAYFLIHDDWMDGDATRRGGPAVHVALGKRLGSTRLGDTAAVLAGDLAAALATEVLAGLDVPPRRLAAALRAFADMQCDAVLGQQLDVLGRQRDAERVYELKTGSYTVSGPLALGALLAGATPTLVEGLRRFALPLGIAFQLRDDAIGLFADPALTGKPFANDLRQGKRTALALHTLKRTRGADRKAFQRAWGNPNATASELVHAVALVESCGAKQLVERRIDALADESLESLRALRCRSAGKRLLAGAVDALVHRGF